jgi:hypothetical protein
MAASSVRVVGCVVGAGSGAHLRLGALHDVRFG